MAINLKGYRTLFFNGKEYKWKAIYPLHQDNVAAVYDVEKNKVMYMTARDFVIEVDKMSEVSITPGVIVRWLEKLEDSANGASSTDNKSESASA